MGSAIGSYVTLASAKLRLLQAGEADTTNDALITSIVNDVNSMIETKTGRAICPIPPYASTISVTAGTNTGTVASATGLAVGDSLLLGLLSGLHEEAQVLYIAAPATGTAWAVGTNYATGVIVHPITPNTHFYQVVSEAGTSNATTEPTWPTDGTAIADGTLIWLDIGTTTGTITVTFDHNLVNAYATAPCQRIYVLDGLDSLDLGRTLIVARGIFAMAALEITTFTGGPFSQIPQTDYFLRPSAYERPPGWPATEIRMTNIPTPGNSAPVFYPAYRSVRLIGPGPCVGLTSSAGFGWAVMPDDIQDVASKLFMATFRERASSGGETFTVNLDGSRVYERALSWEDKAVIERYRVKSMYVVEAGMVG